MRFKEYIIVTIALLAVGVARAQPPTNVEAQRAIMGPVFDEVRLTGSIVPVRATSVSTEVAAQVAEVLVDGGVLVEKDQPLLRLRSTPTELKMLEEEAEVALAQASLEELLNGTRPEDIKVQESLVAEAEADLELAKAEFARFEELLDQDAVSPSEYDRTVAELHKAESRVSKERSELALLREGAREERIDAARALVHSAQARLSQLRDDLDRHTVRAPFRGVIGSKLVEAGQWVRVGDPLFTLAELDVLRAQVELPERYFGRVQEGTPTTLIIDALNSKRIEAPVTVRIPLADMASRTFPVRIDIKNDGYQIAPGMLVRAEIGLPDIEGRESLLVPKDSVVLSPTRERYVWVVVEGEEGLVAERRTIVAGRSFLQYSEVLSGEVEEGDLIVTRGNETLRPGQAVVVKPQSPKQQADAKPAATGAPES